MNLNALDLSSDVDIELLQYLDDVEDEELQTIIIVATVEKYNRKYLDMRPCRTSALTGHSYIIEWLNGHEVRSFDMFRIAPPLFIQFL